MENFQDIAEQRGSSSLEISPASEPVAAVSASVSPRDGAGGTEGVLLVAVPPSKASTPRDDFGPEADMSQLAPVVPLHSRRPKKKQRNFIRSCKTCVSPAVSEVEALCSQGVAATVVGKRLARLSIQRSDLTALTKHVDARVAVMAHRTLLTLAEITGKHLDLLNIGPTNVTTNNVLNLGNSGDVDVMALKALLEAALRPFAGAWPAVIARYRRQRHYRRLGGSERRV